jgi:hexosaminidase
MLAMRVGIRGSVAGVAVGAALVLLLSGTGPAAGSVSHPKQRLLTIPAVRHWIPSGGALRIRAGARIDVLPAQWGSLHGEAAQLSADLRPVLHRRLPVARSTSVRSGDIGLRLDRRLRLGQRPFMRRQGYRLGVTSAVRIVARTRTGLFYGGRTVLQALTESGFLQRGTARDWPRYPQRGLMVDAARTTYTVAWVLREIRELALLKMNVLHLHLTDDQAWHVASHAFPGVVSEGAFTRPDINRILTTARHRHITVIPEIEMPGHLAAFLQHHPNLELKPAAVLSPGGSTEYVSDKLDITDPAALRAMRRVIDEYLRLFPGRYFDIGDDEYLSPAEWAAFPQLAAYAVKAYGVGATPDDAVRGFINWVDRIVRAHHKTLRVWNDQIAEDGIVRLRKDVVIDWWTSVSPVSDPTTIAPATLLARGYRVLNAGWYPNYYSPDIGPVAGSTPPADAYTGWNVSDFYGEAFKGGQPMTRQHVPPGSPGLLGDTLAIWGPLPETPAQTARRVAPRLAVIAQKAWDSPELTGSYARFARLMHQVGVT